MFSYALPVDIEETIVECLLILEYARVTEIKSKGEHKLHLTIRNMKYM